jgi:hypothetical protein
MRPTAYLTDAGFVRDGPFFEVEVTFGRGLDSKSTPTGFRNWERSCPGAHGSPPRSTWVGVKLP